MAYSGIILEKNKEFLLQLRDDKAPTAPNKWALFGGGIEENENPEEAIIREIEEELSIKLNKKYIKLFIKTTYNNEDCYIFRTKINYDLEDLKLNEGADMKFFSKDEIIKLKNTSSGLKDLFKIV
jgi:8-oxo-dGTP diphosphatase